MKVKVKFDGLNSKLLKQAKSNAIDKIATRGIKIVRQEITTRRLINTRNLIDSVGAKKTKSTVTVDVGADYAGILNDGVKRHKMTYLQDRGPIPIVARNGRTVFRMATEKSMTEGKWVHPGFKRGKKFFDNSIEKISTESQKILFNEINKANKG
jgi:hypothetical protein